MEGMGHTTIPLLYVSSYFVAKVEDFDEKDLRALWLILSWLMDNEEIRTALLQKVYEANKHEIHSHVPILQETLKLSSRQIKDFLLPALKPLEEIWGATFLPKSLSSLSMKLTKERKERGRRAGLCLHRWKEASACSISKVKPLLALAPGVARVARAT
jgi:hypothetical protein